jgi:hypothetical protein
MLSRTVIRHPEVIDRLYYYENIDIIDYAALLTIVNKYCEQIVNNFMQKYLTKVGRLYYICFIR